MTTRALAMPDYVTQLVTAPLVRMGFEASEPQDDLIICPLRFEDGTVLSLVVMCVAKRGWLREKPMVVVSVVSLDDNTRAVQVYSRDAMPVPRDPNDWPFVLRFSAKVRATVWSLAATSKMGDCVSLPRRPPA